MLCELRATIRLLLRIGFAGGLLLLIGGCAGMPQKAPEQSTSRTEVLTDTLRARVDRSARAEPSERAHFYERLLVAELSAARGQHEAAAEAFLEATRLFNEKGLARRGIREALAAGRNDLALELARLWQATGEPGAEQHGLLLRLATAAGKAEEAGTHLSGYLEAREDKGAALRDIARTLADLDAHQDLAMQLLEDAVSEHAEDEAVNAQGLYALGLLAYGFEDYARAADASGRAFAQSEPGPLRNRILLLEAGALIRDGRSEQAVARIDEIAEATADPRSVRRSFAELLLQSGETAAARAQIEALLASNPDDNDARLTLGRLAADAGDVSAAREALTRVWEDADGDHGEAALQLGRLAAATGESGLARRWFERAAENGEDLRGELELARMDAEAGEVQAARERLHRLRRGNPAMAPRLLRAEGEILYRSQRYEAAVELLESAVAAYPRDEELRYAYALALEQAGNLAGAETQLRQLISENPDNAAAHNALGYMLTVNDERLDQAEAFISEALRLRPDDPAILDSMGWVHFKRGDADAALDYLQRAFQAFPDAEVGAHLGEVLWTLDRREEAREVWERAREADADHPVLRETLERLLPQ
ncbi:tetratricopeptide repeat protein [Algiphilus aromaticivorans]|uniref:tetratricopeptide repeat protein n=1 Tax=Algiphilus aromaticivorans TaxID=382454 RepID=UPI0005C1E120|nr:tetratricopeptide repeat protein [Algiphilus aromaticivorans]